MSTLPTDRDPSGLTEQPHDEVSARLEKAAAYYRARQSSDLNQSVPVAEYDPVTKRRLFETAPVPLKRLFGSPVVQSGKYAKGPNRERVIASGWGDARSTAYDAHVNHNARHQGLDFTADFGETVLACADGRVTFVGFQSRNRGGIDVDGCTENPANGDILDANGNVVAHKEDVGFGGIIVFVQHVGDFEGYRTEYMHLSGTLVHEGDKVTQGQPIGKVGGSGGYYGFFSTGIHLHWQVSFIAAGAQAVVRPTAMVPNYWPGHDDSTTPSQLGGLTAARGPLPAGLNLVLAGASKVVQVLDRATSVENQTGADLKKRQAEHAAQVARSINVQQAQTYAAVAAFQGQAPVVANPMTFDFDQGVWLPDKGVV